MNKSNVVVLIVALCVGCLLLFRNVATKQSVTWTNNKMMDTPTACYVRQVFLAGTNMTVELGMRSDGVVVWRKVQE